MLSNGFCFTLKNFKCCIFLYFLFFLLQFIVFLPSNLSLPIIFLGFLCFLSLIFFYLVSGYIHKNGCLEYFMLTYNFLRWQVMRCKDKYKTNLILIYLLKGNTNCMFKMFLSGFIFISSGIKNFHYLWFLLS